MVHLWKLEQWIGQNIDKTIPDAQLVMDNIIPIVPWNNFLFLHTLYYKELWNMEQNLKHSIDTLTPAAVS